MQPTIKTDNGISLSRRNNIRQKVPTEIAQSRQRSGIVRVTHDEIERESLRHNSFSFVSPAAALPAPDAEFHLLSRTSYGFDQKELDRVRSIGVEAYIEEQLNPDAIDDSAVEQKIKSQYKKLTQNITKLLNKGGDRPAYELQYSAIYRALYSRRQLYEVMVEFWSNHFSIYLWDEYTPWAKIPDDRDVIRPNALGKFSDILAASSKSVAMLTYLDNDANSRYGPNENYSRELLELHTLGVDGGYTQQDVEEVARCLTGWRLSYGRRTYGEFFFDRDDHDNKAKTVLGHAIPAKGGIRDGEMVIDILASHPSTAKFISTKLCRRFVSDDPPASLVDMVATVFMDTEGDIKEMLREILSSSEFMNARDAKFKRPVEFVCAALKTVGAAFTKDRDEALNWYLYLMGQAPFEWAPPNGYPDVGAAWANTNGMLNRWNFSLNLAQNDLWGVKSIIKHMLATTGAKTATDLVDHFSGLLLNRTLTDTDRAALISYTASGKNPDKPLNGYRRERAVIGLIALLLNSPYFLLR